MTDVIPHSYFHRDQRVDLPFFKLYLLYLKNISYQLIFNYRVSSIDITTSSIWNKKQK